MADQQPTSPLYLHQLSGVRWLVEQLIDKGDVAIIGDEMGTGKTRMSLAFSSYCYHAREIERVLVVCPAVLLENWRNEIEEYYGFPPCMYTSKNKKLEDRFITVMSYELARYKKKGDFVHCRLMQEYFKGKRVLLIADEAHFFCNSESNTNQAVGMLPAKYRLPMTGTPIQNKPEDAFGIVHFIEPYISRNWWMQTYIIQGLKEVPTPRGRRTVYTIEGYRNLDKLNDYFSRIMLRRKKSEVLELPPKSVQYIPYEADKFYDGILDEVDLSDEPMMVKVLRLREAASGLNPYDETKEEFHPGNKLKLLSHLVKSTSDRVIVWFSFVETLKHVKKELEKSGKVCYEWSGRNTSTRRAELEAWKNNPDSIMLVTIAAGGVGLNDFVIASTAIFFEAEVSPAKLRQAEDRIYRKGQDKKTTIIYPYGVGTVEESILSLIRKKYHTTDSIVDKMTQDDLQQIYKYSFKLRY